MKAARALGNVTLHVIEGPEEYLFGEEKALLEVCEGNDPIPREPHYPPYERGLFATQASPNPAIVNNVETLARVPGILRAGAASFRAIGTADTPGPIIFTISGDVRRPGVYEAAAGTKLSHLFHELAGGPREGRAFKAALSGVSTLSIPASRFDTQADHASMHMIGSGLGSAGFILFDDLASMPRVTQAVARFLYVESCNQCPACKNGLRTASSAIDELFDPALATPDDFERAFYGAHRAPQGNRCYLPVQGSKLIPDLMKRFEGEFAAQLEDPTGAPAPYVIPKLVDFDEARGEFVYDELQPRKNPNWTYAPAPEPAPESVPKMAVPEPRKPAKPAQPVKAEGLQTISVRLMADVRTELAKVLKDRHNEAELDRVVNDALREWMRGREKR
ncbi:MAG: NADH-ubiquinone oxidoreductase-F iron-sulfur binding region domain-containing protein, partial [Polyangiales bacterium]